MSVTNTAVSLQAAGSIPDGPCGDDDCGIRDVLDRLGDRWTVLVIVELSKECVASANWSEQFLVFPSAC